MSGLCADKSKPSCKLQITWISSYSFFVPLRDTVLTDSAYLGSHHSVQNKSIGMEGPVSRHEIDVLFHY